MTFCYSKPKEGTSSKTFWRFLCIGFSRNNRNGFIANLHEKWKIIDYLAKRWHLLGVIHIERLIQFSATLKPPNANTIEHFFLYCSHRVFFSLNTKFVPFQNEVNVALFASKFTLFAVQLSWSFCAQEITFIIPKKWCDWFLFFRAMLIVWCVNFSSVQ